MPEGPGNGTLIRTDGGRQPGLSYGHVMRCLALAGELRDRELGPVRFLVRTSGEALDLIRDEGFAADALPPGTDDATALASAPESRIVADSPLLGDLAAARRPGRVLLRIDDTGGPSLGPDLLVNGSLVREARDYPDAAARGVRIFGGPGYCVLGPGFDRPPPPAEGPGRLLVTFGGSDPGGLTLWLLRRLAADPALLAGWQPTVVLGPGFAGDDEAEARRLAAVLPGAEVKRHVACLRTEMAAAGAVVAAGGRTAYELAALGRPALLIPSIAHEEPVAAAFQTAGAALALAGRDSDALADALPRLLGNDHLRRSLAAAGRRLVDGQGRRRVADLLDHGPAGGGLS